MTRPGMTLHCAPVAFFARSFSAGRILFTCAACVALLFAACGKKTAPAAKSGLRLKWQYKSTGSALSHPAVAPDGTIYVGTNRGLVAVSPEGTLVWETTFDAANVPVVSDDGTIYLDTWHGLLFGVNQHGQIVWRPGYGMNAFHAPPALGPATTLYYLNGSADIWAFQPKMSDRDIWHLETFREGMLGAATVLPGSARAGGSSGAPLLTRASSIILPRQNFLHSISASGNPEWDLELSSGGLGQAALANDGTIYVGDGAGVLYAVDPSGSVKWRFDAAGITGSPVIDMDGVIYLTGGGAVYAVTPDGSLKWRFAPQLPLNVLTSPVLAADGTLYLGGEFALIALRPDGTLKSNLRVFTPTSALAIAPDGTIYFACGYAVLCAAEDAGSPLMQSAWPKPFHDLANTSNPLHGRD
jgi:outer membrane protein assembly factor BamB